MATLQQLETALINADKAGDQDAARQLAAVIQRARQDPANQIPDSDVQETIQRPEEPTMGQQIIGAGDAALSSVPMAVAGGVGMIGGTLKGLAEQLLSGQFGTQDAADAVEKSAMEGAQAFAAPFAPETKAGQDILTGVGETLAPMVAATPFGAELGVISRGATQAAKSASPVVAAGVQRAAPIVMTAAQKIKNIVPGTSEPAQAGPAKSAGAAAADLETVRREKAAGLPVPMRLTAGEATRDPDQLAFEKDQIKTPEGDLLRKRQNDNNMQALQNFEALVDVTGAETPDLISSGNKAIDALSKGWKNAKTETNAAYSAFRNSEESKAPVDPAASVTIGEGESQFQGSLLDYLNSKPRGVPSSAVTDSVRQIAQRLGVAVEDEQGNLTALPTTSGSMEGLRREISGLANRAEAPQIRDETILKKIIDAQNDPVAGELLKKARMLRIQQGRKYENRSIVANLITNRRGMDDPKVAADQVLRKSILNASPDEVTFLKRVMLTSGEEGRQAWKDIQGALVKHIQDEATKGMGMDANDQPMVSGARLNAVIDQLDRNERLDIVLGKEVANRVRDLNDVLRYINTVPPGTLINNSGTPRALLSAIGESVALGSTTGIPLPVITTLKLLKDEVKNAKIKAKIKKALEG